MKFMAWTRVKLVINGVIRQYINAPDYMINMWLSPEWERGDYQNICSVISPGQGCLMGSSFNFSSNHWNFHFMFAVPFLLQMSWHYNHESWPFTVSLLLLSLPATYVSFFCLIYSSIYANSWQSLVSSASLAVHWAQHLITSFLLHLPFAMSLLLLIRFANATGFPPCNLEKITAASSLSPLLL